VLGLGWCFCRTVVCVFLWFFGGFVFVLRVRVFCFFWFVFFVYACCVVEVFFFCFLFGGVVLFCLCGVFLFFFWFVVFCNLTTYLKEVSVNAKDLFILFLDKTLGFQGHSSRSSATPICRTKTISSKKMKFFLPSRTSPQPSVRTCCCFMKFFAARSFSLLSLMRFPVTS